MEIARILRIDLLVKLALAVLLGGIIGFEREIGRASCRERVCLVV